MRAKCMRSKWVCAILCAMGVGCGFEAREPISVDGGSAVGGGGDPGGGEAGDGGSTPIHDGGGGGSGTGSGGGSGQTLTWSETSSDQVDPSAGAICANPGGASSADEAWYRLFRPVDFQVSTDVHVVGVKVVPAIAKAARGLTVRIGTYSGAFGAATLDLRAVTMVATATVDIADTAGTPAPLAVQLPIDATIHAGETVIGWIESPSLSSTGGAFVLGATTASETAPGYFSAVSCLTSTPQSEAALGITGHFVLDLVVATR